MEAPESVVSTLIARAKSAMEAFDSTSQEAIDDAVTALAWSIYKPGNARRLAELAVESTGLGNVEDKVTKNQRKTFGTLRDLMRVKTTGVIEDLPELGLVKYAKPIGVGRGDHAVHQSCGDPGQQGDDGAERRQRRDHRPFTRRLCGDGRNR